MTKTGNFSKEGTSRVTPGERLAPSEMEALLRFSAAGLVQMVDPQSGVFCNRMMRPEGQAGAKGVVRDGLSPRYTTMTLLGLHRMVAAGIPSPVDLQAVQNALFADRAWITNVGDLGMLLWLAAVTCPERLPEVYGRYPIDAALSEYSEAREGRTTELAWFLAGLSHAELARSPGTQSTPGPRLRELAVNTYELLKKNQGAHGFFGHQSTRGNFTGAVRGRIGSFADQVYPIYAFSHFSQAFGVQGALDLARQCADGICEAQGALGQWWWHYESTSGKVIQRYPVYSVHQDAMAPMALFALSDVTGADYSGPIYKGLDWIYGKNELNVDLRDTASSVIWRCIFHQGWTKYPREVAEFLLPIENERSVDDLRILHESRPYHLGWLLYAFAGRTGA